MKAPQLNRFLSLEAPQDLSDGAGGYSRAWHSLGQIWAEISPATARAPAGEELRLSEVNWRVVIRAAPFGTPQRPVAGQRLRQGTRIFSIFAVSESDPSGRWLICHCKEQATP